MCFVDTVEVIEFLHDFHKSESFRMEAFKNNLDLAMELARLSFPVSINWPDIDETRLAKWYKQVDISQLSQYLN